MLLLASASALTTYIASSSTRPCTRTPHLIGSERIVDATDGRYTYEAKVQEAVGTKLPILAIPPIGVGISRKFYDPLHREWGLLGTPCSLHTPDLLGCGSAHPKPRRFYTPEIYADQLLAYVHNSVQQPVVLAVQGGLLPVALEMWRKGGEEAIAAVSFISPPPLRFFSPEAGEEEGVRSRFREGGQSRGRTAQRLFWLLAQSSAGGAFFRYLRGSKGRRIRSFSERNLFADPSKVDDEWMSMCTCSALEPTPTEGEQEDFVFLHACMVSLLTGVHSHHSCLHRRRGVHRNALSPCNIFLPVRYRAWWFMARRPTRAFQHADGAHSSDQGWRSAGSQ